MKQLSSDQIKELHDLVRRDAVGYYEVTLEIVDHYASAIETIWEKEPDLSFYQAQMRVYKEFWDFQGFQKKRQELLFKNARQEFLNKLKSLFGWPQIIELIILSFLLFVILNYLEHSTTWTYWPTTLNLLFIFTTSVSQFYILLRFETKMKRPFLRIDAISSIYCYFPHTLPFISILFLLFQSTWAIAVSAILMAIYFLGLRAIHFSLLQEMHKIERQYA